VHVPELVDVVDPPEDPVAVDAGAAEVVVGDDAAVVVSAEPEPLPVGVTAGADAALVANTPPPAAEVAVEAAVGEAELELAAVLVSLPLLLDVSEPELEVPSKVTPVAKQLSPVMSA